LRKYSSGNCRHNCRTASRISWCGSAGTIIGILASSDHNDCGSICRWCVTPVSC